MPKALHKLTIGITTVVVALTGFTALGLVTAPIASADSWENGSEADTGNGQIGDGGGNTNPPSNTGGGGNGGGGGIPDGGSVDACAYKSWGCDGNYQAEWIYNWGSGSSCSADSIGNRKLKETFLETTSKDKAPNKYPGVWASLGVSGQGTYSWTATVYSEFQCIEPPNSYLDTQRCILHSTVNFSRTEPDKKTLLTKTQQSGFTKASRDYNACKNSDSKVNASVDINEYGFYESQASSRAVNAKIKVYTERDPRTGQVPATEIVGYSGEYTIRPNAKTASLHCSNGFRSPGINFSNWTENGCSSENSNNPTYQCKASPVRFDTADGGATNMRAFKNNTIQFMRDGYPRKTVFNQRVVGNGINVNSNRVRFHRSANSTPWDESASYYNNYFELRASENGSSVLTRADGESTKWFSGRQRDMWTVGYTASNSGSPTRISQELSWKGTRTIQSARITEINAATGKISYVPVTKRVKTSGYCSDKATIEYVRAIGDTW